MAAPQPSQQQLEGVVRALESGLNVADKEAQVRVNDWIESNAQDPAFNSSLAIVATSPGTVRDEVRRVAALALKNNCVRFYDEGIAPASALVQQRLQDGLADQCDGVRSDIASCISRTAWIGGLKDWPALVPALCSHLQQAGHPAHRRGVLICLRDICEDCAEDLDRPFENGTPAQAEHLVPQLVQLIGATADPHEMAFGVDAIRYLLESGTATRRRSTINQKFVELSGPVYCALMKCVQCCASAGPTMNRVRCSALACLRLQLKYYDQLKAAGVLAQLYRMIYDAMNESDPDVSKVACEFWHQLVGSGATTAVQDLTAAGILHQVIAQLLDKMVYSDLEVAMLEHEESAEQLNPPRAFAHRPRGRRHIEDDEEDEPDGPSGIPDGGHFAVRHFAAETLDMLAEHVQDAVVTPPGQEPGWLLSTQIQPRLMSGDWRAQEVAVLALGAIAKGPKESLRPHIPQLLEMLLAAVGDRTGTYHWLVVAISFWTLSRLDDYIIFPELGGNDSIYSRYLTQVIAGMTHPKRKVQENAVSAFAEAMQNSPHMAGQEKYLALIIPALAPCLVPRAYTARNMVILLDAIQSLSFAANASLNTPLAHTHLLSPLVNQLLPHTPDDSTYMPNLLNTLTVMLKYLGDVMAPYVEVLFTRALRLIGDYLKERGRFMTDPAAEEEPDEEVYIMCWDVLGAIVGCVSKNAAAMQALQKLYGETTYPGTPWTALHLSLVPITRQDLCLDERPTTAALGFAGENMKHFPALTGMVLEQVPAMLKLTEEVDGTCNDTLWLLGELALVIDSVPVEAQQLDAAVGAIAQRLVAILADDPDEYYDNLLQNCAIATGRLGHCRAHLVAPGLATFARPLLEHLASVPGGDEKEQAFHGAMLMVRANFAVVQDDNILSAVFLCMASFDDRSKELTQQCLEFMHGLKAASGAHWSQILSNVPRSFPADLRIA